MNVSFRPFHYLAKLIPILYLLKRQMLNGSARDYKAVVIITLDLVKGLIESKKMIFGYVLSLMALRMDQLKLHLKGRVTEKS